MEKKQNIGIGQELQYKSNTKAVVIIVGIMVLMIVSIAYAFLSI
jgi:hypothetical protein